jgi:hypothetical protein
VIIYFDVINQYLKENKGIKKVIYKSIPFIYSNVPAQEDEYVLFRLNARLISCGISSAIRMDKRLPFSSSRKGCIKKAQKNNLEIRVDHSFSDFWEILSENLEKRHKAKPVHSLEEIVKLKERFQENIKLYNIYLEGKCIAGAVMYLTANVAHVQYISANECGKSISALDFLFDYLINHTSGDIEYFDFGTSVERSGHYLNTGLSFQKQGFGGRGIVYKQFEYEL